MTHVRAVLDVVGWSTGRSAKSQNNMNNRKYNEAEKIVESAGGLLKVKPSFDALAGSQVSPDFERFYALVTENRFRPDSLKSSGRGSVKARRLARVRVPYLKAMNAWNETWQSQRQHQRDEPAHQSDREIRQERTVGPSDSM